MKTQERTKATTGETLPPGGLAKAEPGGLAAAADGETPGAGPDYRKMRWLAGLYAGVAALWVAAGDGFDAIFWASLALYFALAGESRRRVPKLVKYAAIALVTVLGVIKVVRVILQVRAG
jgi:hypothetical protein